MRSPSIRIDTSLNMRAPSQSLPARITFVCAEAAAAARMKSATIVVIRIVCRTVGSIFSSAFPFSLCGLPPSTCAEAPAFALLRLAAVAFGGGWPADSP